MLAFAPRHPRLATLALAAVALVAGALAARTETHHEWQGLYGMIAPRTGPLTIDVDGDRVVCAMTGEARHAHGNGWAFRGTTTVATAACAGFVKDGLVDVTLAIDVAWSGQSRGWDSDWDDEAGAASCAGPLRGSLEQGGTWTGTCTNRRGTWSTSMTWTRD